VTRPLGNRSAIQIECTLGARVIAPVIRQPVLVLAGRFRHFATMTLGTLILFFIACGAATFPLTLMAVRYAAALSPASAFAQKIGRGFETALSLSFVIWLLGALVFYAIALQIERQKPCDDQHTNQLTPECRKMLGAKD
jgi:hypothetical protein